MSKQKCSKCVNLISGVVTTPEGYQVTFLAGKQRGPAKEDRFLIPKVASTEYGIFRAYIEAISSDIGPSAEDLLWYKGTQPKMGVASKFCRQVSFKTIKRP